MSWNLCRNWWPQSWWSRWQHNRQRLRPLTWVEWLLIVEAVVFLGLVRLAVLLLPFRWFGRYFGLFNGRVLAADDKQAATAKRVGVYLYKLSHLTPWPRRNGAFRYRNWQ